MLGNLKYTNPKETPVDYLLQCPLVPRKLSKVKPTHIWLFFCYFYGLFKVSLLGLMFTLC